MIERNESIVRNVSKDEWKNKDIVQCIFDENDDECNLKPGTIADLAMVRTNKSNSFRRFPLLIEPHSSFEMEVMFQFTVASGLHKTFYDCEH